MAVWQISKIQVRRGKKGAGTGIPQLSSGELGWAIDSQELFIGNGSLTEGAPAVGNTRILTEHDLFSPPVTSVNGMTGDVVINSAVNGFAGITDVTTPNPADANRITDKVTASNGQLISSCTSWTNTVRINFLATTGAASLIPDIQIKIGNAAWQTISAGSLTPSADKSVWTGYYDATLSGNTVISIKHSENASLINTCTITVNSTPVITSFVFTGNYPNSQTQYSEDQPIGVQIASSSAFVSIEFDNTAYASKSPIGETSVGSVTTYTGTIVAANRGNTTTALPARARIKNSAGVWSDWVLTNNSGSVDHVNVVNLNNSSPAVSYSSITYPVSQQAIKTGDSGATISGITFTNTTSVLFSSSQVSISNPAVIENSKTVTTTSGAYNITAPNITVSLTNSNNGRTATASWLVNVADLQPTVTISKPAGRYRTGKGYTANNTPGQEYAAAPSYTITITSDQKLMAAPSLTPSAGVFQGSWVTSDNGFTWTRILQILDGATLGAATLTNLTVVSLSNSNYTTASPANNTYTVGGFASRSGVFSPQYSNEANIGTNVSDTSKLVVTMNQLSANYYAGVRNYTRPPNGDSEFTITSPAQTFNAGGNILHNNDVAMVGTNSTGTMPFTIEELA